MTEFFQLYEGAHPDAPAISSHLVWQPIGRSASTIFHGSLAYLVRRADSQLFKMRSEHVRSEHVYDDRLRTQDLPANWTSAVVIGGRKEGGVAAL